MLVEDLAWWAGMRMTTAAQCLEEALEADPALGRYRLEAERLVPAEPARYARERAGLLYMRRDVPDVLAAQRRRARALMFLPSFDELYVGYANRTCLTDADGDRLICPSRNGMFRPLIVHRGRLIGVRPVSEGLQWCGEPDERLVARTEALVERTLARLTR